MRKIHCKQAYDMTDQELARIVKLFYDAQLKYPRGMDRAMKGEYLDKCIDVILKTTGISPEMLRDALMILYKREVLLSQFDVSEMRIVSVRAGSNALVFIQTTLQAKREQIWTRWLAIVAILISVLALGAQIGDAFGWITPISESAAQPAKPAQSIQPQYSPQGTGDLSGTHVVPAVQTIS